MTRACHTTEMFISRIPWPLRRSNLNKVCEHLFLCLLQYDLLLLNSCNCNANVNLFKEKRQESLTARFYYFRLCQEALSVAEKTYFLDTVKNGRRIRITNNLFTILSSTRLQEKDRVRKCLETTVLYREYNTKMANCTSINEISTSCPQYMLRTIVICENELERVWLGRQSVYDCSDCVYCILHVDFNGSFRRRNRNAQKREIEGLERMQNIAFLSVYYIAEAVLYHTASSRYWYD